MACMFCASGNQSEFGSEILIHFLGLKNLDKPPVWAFPRLLICLDCGFSPFHLPPSELAVLAKGTVPCEVSTAQTAPDLVAR